MRTFGNEGDAVALGFPKSKQHAVKGIEQPYHQ